METKKPIRVFKSGGIRAVVWCNTIAQGGKDIDVHSVQINRTYKQFDEFKTTNSFNVRDLPKVELVARKAFEFLSLEVQKNAQDQEG